MYFCFSLFFIS
jgi:NAD(P)-dependent dehydrogenase (short-subunit alcohol dehydrogenase family)